MRRRSIWRLSASMAISSGPTGESFRACTDLSDGGLALAAFEMAEGARLGVVLDSGRHPDAVW